MKRFFVVLWMMLALTGNSWAWSDMAWDLSTKYAGVVRKTAAPTTTDSSYKIGTIWINTSTEDVYILADNTSAAAVWTGTRQVKATLGSELLTWGAAAWDEDGSTWTFASSTLTHVTGNTTAVTSTLGAAIAIGTTYKVTITGTGGTATATYTLGGVTGTTIAASGAIAIEDYITAVSTGVLIITPANTCTVALTNVSVKALTAAAGDVTIDGNLTVRSPVTFYGGLTMTFGQILGTGGVGTGKPLIAAEGDNTSGLSFQDSNLIYSSGANAAFAWGWNGVFYVVASGQIGFSSTTSGATLAALDTYFVRSSAGNMQVKDSLWPLTDNTGYLGKNDDDTPFAWKGVCLKDTTNGVYYRLEIINGVVTATSLTD